MSRKKVVPSPDDLKINENAIVCTEEGCTQIFRTPSNMRMHITRHHKREALSVDPKRLEQIEYHCPAEYCCYNIQRPESYFTQFKYLKQHFLKVHGKTIECDDCTLRFSSETQRKAHEKFCGVQFQCSECDCQYNTYDSLVCHSKRKKHKIKPKSEFAEQDEDEKVKSKPVEVVTKRRSVLPVLLPKPVNKDVKKSQDVGLQIQLTCCKCKCKSIYRRTPKTRTVETQTDTYITTIDTPLKRDLEATDILILHPSNSDIKKLKIDPITVISPILPDAIPETTIPLENYLNSSPQTSSGTLYVSEADAENYVYQFETTPDEFNFKIENNPPIILDEFNNIETQTAWSNLNDDLFVSTETQTAWPLLNDDFLVNTETQTLNEFSHNQTQTDFILPFLPDIS